MAKPKHPAHVRNAILALKGQKTAEEIAIHFDMTRGMVTGIWWRNNPVNKLAEAARKRRERKVKKYGSLGFHGDV